MRLYLKLFPYLLFCGLCVGTEDLIVVVDGILEWKFTKDQEMIRADNRGIIKIKMVQNTSLESCEKISLSTNNLTHLPEDIFETSPNVKVLWLDCNQLEVLSQKTLEPLSKLETLNLRENRLREFYFPMSVELSTMYISNNLLFRVIWKKSLTNKLATIKLENNSLSCETVNELMTFYKNVKFTSSCLENEKRLEHCTKDPICMNGSLYFDNVKGQELLILNAYKNISDWKKEIEKEPKEDMSCTPVQLEKKEDKEPVHQESTCEWSILFFSMLVVIVFINLALWRIWRRKKTSKVPTPVEEPDTELPEIPDAVVVEPNLIYQKLHIEHEDVSFQETDIIGEGHYSRVYRGQLGERAVAVKIIRRNTQDVLREVMIQRRLNHENIAKVLKYSISSPTAIVMELAQGLLTYLQDLKAEPVNGELVKISHGVVKGMLYLEKQNVIHRDLAARNILIDAAFTAKITDFGLAQHVGKDNTYQSKHNRSLPWKWYSPEAIEDEQYSHKLDVWSYGVLLYEIFSGGQTPYDNWVIHGRSEILLEKLEAGDRLDQPKWSSAGLYDEVMMKCWEWKVDIRIDFENIRKALEKLYPERCLNTTTSTYIVFSNKVDLNVPLN